MTCKRSPQGHSRSDSTSASKSDSIGSIISPNGLSTPYSARRCTRYSL